MTKNMLLTGALMLMMASCSNEEILPNEEVKNNAEPTLTIIATQGEDTDSRLAYNPSADGKTISLTWSEGDVIYVSPADDPIDYVELTLTEGAGTNRGTFSTDDDIDWEEGTELVAYYKANDSMYDYDSDYYYFFYVNFDAVQQTQIANGSMTHLAEVNYMTSEGFEYQPGTVSNLYFAQQGAIMQLDLSGLEGKRVTELKLCVDDDTECLLESRYFEYDREYEEGYDEIWYISSVSLSLGIDGEGITLGADETLTAYIMLGATEETDGKTLTLIAQTTDGVYSASLTGGALVAGKKYTLGKEMKPYTLWAEGVGTAEAPFQIATEDDLLALHTWLKLGFSTKGLHFKLMNDIEMTSRYDRGLISIGGDLSPHLGLYSFEGVFDGNGKTISSLTYVNSNYSNVGLFYAISADGVVKNLHLTDANLLGNTYVGGIASINHGTIEGCSVTGQITAKDMYVGGIAGKNEGTIIACSNGATVSSNGDGMAGGIAGITETGCTIIGCYNTGSISGPKHIGGILGYAASGSPVTMTACYNTGTVSSNNETSAGNMIGTNAGTATFQSCCWATGVGVGSGSENASWGGGGGSGYNNAGYADWVTRGMVENMNYALNYAGVGWRYEANEDEATKELEPYRLQKVTP